MCGESVRACWVSTGERKKAKESESEGEDVERRRGNRPQLVFCRGAGSGLLLFWPTIVYLVLALAYI